MAIGRGFPRTDGRGSEVNRGAGLHITTDAGFTTTATGRGRHAVNFTGGEVGGVPRWSRS